jgi:5-formyltetrahydrofolate cyclo-ligase
MPDAALKARKAELRKELMAVRSREAAQLPKAGAALAARFPEALLPRAGQVLSAYAPFGDEMDPTHVMAAARDRGAALALPVVVKKGEPLIFRQWDFGQPLEPGVWGIAAPPASAAVVAPDVLLVPLLGFDHFGWRLGYGGGFYDRTLAGLRALKPITAVGVAYEVQRLPEVPRGPTDEPLDWIVTEAAAYQAVRDGA